MTEDLLDHLQGHACGRERARRGMAEVVESESPRDPCDSFRSKKRATQSDVAHARAIMVNEHIPANNAPLKFRHVLLKA
jgi:hypothetical protein